MASTTPNMQVGIGKALCHIRLSQHETTRHWSRYKCRPEEMELCQKDILDFDTVPCASITPCIATRKLL
jgi:hypothetical protein